MRRYVHLPEEKKDGPEEIQKLREMARRKPSILAPQLIYFGANSKNLVEGNGVLDIMVSLGDYPDLRMAVIPFLDSPDKRIQEMAGYWLGAMDVKIGPASSLLRYRKLLLAKKDAPPPGLVRYLFENARSESLLFFGGIYEFPKSGAAPGELNIFQGCCKYKGSRKFASMA